MQPDMREKKHKDLLGKIRDRYRIMYDADHENRLEAMEDLKFVNVPGYQWDDNMKQERGTRPCYEFNKIRVSGKRIINDMRANRPQGKVRAVEGGDKDIAEINEGLIRNIWNISDADSVIDYEAEFQVNAGMAAWRVDTEYVDDSAFEQDICIKPIQNPFCLYADPGAKDFLKRDADDWILTEKMPLKAYEARWPKAEISNFEDSIEFDDEQDWQDEESVRIAEYWWKEPHKKEVWQLDDGTVVDSESDEANAPELQERIVKRREVMTHKIMHCIASGQRILDEPQEWAGTEFPFVMIYGEYLVVDGRPYWWGLPRFAKDAQRSYNVARTAISETIAQAPKSHWWATSKQAAGLEDQWAEAHKKNYPWLIYNADEKTPGPPQRMGGPEVPIALIQESQMASEEIKAVTGIFDASLGNKSNEQSGRAIYARQQQGEIATFNYQDNMAKGIQRTYELVLDLIPHIYDTERELRILGSDGAEDYQKVNQVVFDPEAGRSVRVNDITTGKYDVTITVGPSFATLRQEAAEVYGQLTQQFPELMGVAGDLVFKSMDLPYAEDIAERLKAVLPPEVQQIINKDKSVTPEVQQAMQQADQAMQQVQEYGQLVDAANQELEEQKSVLDKDKAEIKAEISNLKAAKAEFDAHIAKATSDLVTREADLKLKEAGLTSKAAEMKGQIAETSLAGVDAAIEGQELIMSIDGVLADFMEVASNTMQVLDEKAQNLEKRTLRKPIGGSIRREGGKTFADIEFDDGDTRTVAAIREGGQLKLVGADAGPEPAA